MQGTAGDHSTPSALEGVDSSPKIRRWLWLAGSLVLVVAACVIIALVNNNYSLNRQSQSEFTRQLESSLSAAIDYMDSRRMELGHYNANSALTFMIRDMAVMTGDDRLHSLVNGYVLKFPNYFWQRMIFWQHPDPENEELNELTGSQLLNLTADQRWFYFVVGGTNLKLEDNEMATLMSPTDCVARKLTHQLFALNLLQASNEDDESLRDLRMTLCDRIARETAFDCRVTDLYYQRLAFLLMSEREDLIKPRWTELLMKFQQADGGWGFAYRPLLWESVFGEQASDDHASVQAAWVLCQLKHRYPDWITTHYQE